MFFASFINSFLDLLSKTFLARSISSGNGACHQPLLWLSLCPSNQSPTVARDLVEQCSQKTFIACYEIFAKKYNNPTDSLKVEIVKYDPRTASSSDFSLWIRTRFIQEIFKQKLEKEAFEISK